MQRRRRSGSRAQKPSDADREAALEVIRRAYTAGLIDLDDLEARAAVALLCVTVRELTDLTGDLPAIRRGSGQPSPPVRSSAAARRY